jgi:superfamily I DNA/RNA helicase
MDNVIQQKTNYENIQKKRGEYVEAILNSTSNKKVVVAGPGTGKTYLFKEILKDNHNSLTLTFVNSLVEDLSLELFGMAEVKTLHSFARSILSNITKKDIRISPILSKIIKEDAQILLNKEIDFDRIFYEIDEENEFFEFYRNRKNYYNYYGYTDIIYAVVKCFEQDKKRIPTYQIVLIDEFQDFNKLEVSLIELLEEKSPILLAGDDDQALYDFKSASTKYIREKYNDSTSGYASFTLPFCTRCTRVVVESINDVIDSAIKNGFLSGRINKPYNYFDCEKKDLESEKYPKIGYTQQFSSKIPWFIEKKIAKMANDLKSEFTVLIISPYKKQSFKIAKSLKNKGLNNIEYSSKDESELTLLDGIKLLIEDIHDNLGWRIASKFLLNEEDFNSLLQTSYSNPEKNIYDLLDSKIKKEIKNITKVLKYVKNDKPVNKEQFGNVLEKINYDPYAISELSIKENMNHTAQRIGIPAIRKIPIKSTTIQSSKGLSGDLVFITHFDDRYFIKNKDKTKISDQDICNFLVSLSRTKQRVYLISSKEEKPKFLKWISENRIEIIR